MERDVDCGMFLGQVVVKPPITTKPTICCPVSPSADRHLGFYVCELTYIAELLPLIANTFFSLFGGSDTETTDSTGLNELDESSTLMRDADGIPVEPVSKSGRGTFSYSVSLVDIRLFLLDPVLGHHLPIAVLTISSLRLAASKFAQEVEAGIQTEAQDEGAPSDLQITVCSTCWIDCFKLGMTRSWEPFLEAYSFNALCERSGSRGTGLSFKSESKMHLNVSSALVGTMSSMIEVVSQLAGVKPGYSTRTVSNSDQTTIKLSSVESFKDFEILHQVQASSADRFRVPFVICNMTGGRIRTSQPTRRSGQKIEMVYLDEGESAKLDFFPTVTIVKNLKLVEVAYPGLQKGGIDCDSLPPQTLDVQLEGFEWIRMIKVDSIGRRFAKLQAKLPGLEEKIAADWKIQNVMNVLVETGLQHGGRQVNVRSVFTVVNNTGKALDVRVSPEAETADRTFDSDLLELCAPQTIPPGQGFSIPSLLIESALHLGEDNLGFLALRPSSNSLQDRDFTHIIPDASNRQSFNIGYSSKPLSLMGIVKETQELFNAAGLIDVVEEHGTTGVQSPCPLWSESGCPLASFFIQFEVGRSPITARHDSRENNAPLPVHGPVLYTITAHPPLVISNLLPKAGRFTLKHAARDVVVWYAHLEPGEEASVHTIGLDAPLLLFINLGFAKTPVGEGALIHHGSVNPESSRGTPTVNTVCVIHPYLNFVQAI